MKLVPTMVSEAAASTHKHHLLETAVPTSTNLTTKKHEPSADADSQRRCLQEDCDVAAAIARSVTQS
jgi:hypothetical protein